MKRVADKIDAIGIRRRLGPGWGLPMELGEDGWVIDSLTRRVIVSVDESSEPEVDWIHASISNRNTSIIPSYNDLKRLHAAVFGHGYAYQVFAPPAAHVNIRNNVLHLWGRLDGNIALPDFGRFGTI